MQKILIEKRSDDFKAHVEGKPELWGCGNSPDAAVGDLVRSHYDYFNIRTEWKQ